MNCTLSTHDNNLNSTEYIMEKRKLGLSGPEVSVIGLGCMNMSHGYGNNVERKDMIKFIHYALDHGVTMFDTAEMYGPFTNEELLGDAFKDKQGQAIIATKFGFDYDPKTNDILGLNSHPDHIRKSVEGSLRRLKTDRIDLLYQHRVDPNVPMEDVAGTVKELINEGKVGYFGLSAADEDSIRKAHAVHPVTVLQSEYSLWNRDIEKTIFPTLKELGIGFVPYGPLGHGLLTGKIDATTKFASNDIRNRLPQFSEESRKKNQSVFSLFSEFAVSKEVTPTQLALAWIINKHSEFVPIPGTTKLARLEENIGSVQVKLSQEDVNEIEKIVQVEK